MAYGQKAELASVKIGVQNATEALQALEMANNAISKMSEMVVRLEELNALGAMGLIVPTTMLQLQLKLQKSLLRLQYPVWSQVQGQSSFWHSLRLDR